MYDEILNNLTYQILFDFDNFKMTFWNSIYWLSGAFLAFWGVKLGASFLKRAFE